MLNFKRWMTKKTKIAATESNQEIAWADCLDYRCSEIGRMGNDSFRYHEWPLENWYEPAAFSESSDGPVLAQEPQSQAA